MGELYLHNLDDYITKYGCSVFVETGTGKGVGLSTALKFPFKKLYSIEIMESLFLECLEKFKEDRVEILNESSIEGLKVVLEKIEEESSAFFWLDAHFPGADFHLNSYDYLIDQPKLHKPLKNEIQIISGGRDTSKDVFIIDDLQIYEEGPYELLNQEFVNKYGSFGLDFIEDCFSESHTFTRDYRHQGFLILTPK